MVNLILSFTYSFIAAIVFVLGMRFLAYACNISTDEIIDAILWVFAVFIWIFLGGGIIMEASHKEENLIDFWRKTKS
jgi:hypothetical protein